MKSIHVTASIIVSTIVFSTSAFAQVSLKGEVMPGNPAYYNWTGFYAGLNAGIVNHTMNITDSQGAYFLSTIQQVSNPKFTGGLQVGYRQQMDLASVSGVYGLELGANFADAQYNREIGSPSALYQFTSENKLKTVALLELMGGVAANRTLLFLAAGLSWTNITGSTTNTDDIVFSNSFSMSKKQLGTVLGGGIEYAFTDRISARIKVDVITPNTYTTSDDVNDTFQISNNIVQATLGINYKFA